MSREPTPKPSNPPDHGSGFGARRMKPGQMRLQVIHRDEGVPSLKNHGLDLDSGDVEVADQQAASRTGRPADEDLDVPIDCQSGDPHSVESDTPPRTSQEVHIDVFPSDPTTTSTHDCS